MSALFSSSALVFGSTAVPSHLSSLAAGTPMQPAANAAPMAFVFVVALGVLMFFSRRKRSTKRVDAQLVVKPRPSSVGHPLLRSLDPGQARLDELDDLLQRGKVSQGEYDIIVLNLKD